MTNYPTLIPKTSTPTPETLPGGGIQYRLAAEQGDATAQFNFGVMHAAGEGVLKDSVLAHMWSNIAGANGNASARKLRDSLERDMTRAEVSRATELASPHPCPDFCP